MLYIVFVLFFAVCTAEQNVPDEKFVLYADIKPANRTESLLKIRNVPIVYYKFKYDSILDRSQMGILGPDAQKYFPESIDVVPSKTFSSKDRSKPAVVLTNFPVVDKNVLFMHGLVAVQELIHKYDELNDLVGSLDTTGNTIKAELKEIENQLHMSVSQQMKEKLQIAQLDAEATAKQIELDDIKAKEDRIAIEKELSEERNLLEFESQLSRERMARQEQFAKENTVQLMKMERELAEKRELMSRETAEALQKMRLEQNRDLDLKKLEYEKEKIKAELDAKAVQKKANQEMELHRIQTQSKLDTERMVTGIKTISLQLSRITQEIFSKPKQVAIIAGIILALTAIYYSIKEASKLLRQYIQSRIGKPSLVRETSYTWSFLPTFLTDLLTLLRLHHLQSKEEEEISHNRLRLAEEFRNVILSEDDKQRVLNLALATRNTRRSGAPYRHVLLHGPPGTGKTLIARQLAICSDMDYAIMSGGDVGPLGEDAVSQLHGLFHWAASSRRGLLVFIDEAEAFLAARDNNNSNNEDNNSSSSNASVHTRNALNALLYQTGTPSYNFMLVLATNRPEDLDAAVLDRIDISIPISPPALAQRKDLVKLYMDIYLTKASQQQQRSRQQQSVWKYVLGLYFHGQPQRTVEEGCLCEEIITKIASAIEGFSGREIAKLFIAAQYAMYLAPNNTLTVSLLMQTVAVKVEEHFLKRNGFERRTLGQTESMLATTGVGAGGLVKTIKHDIDGEKGKQAIGGLNYRNISSATNKKK